MNNAPAVRTSNPDLVAYEAFLDAIPEVEVGSYAGILERLANAKSIFELDSPFRGESMAEWKDRPVLIEAAKQAPSDFADGLGVYLILDCVDPETGDKFSVSTGSVVCVAQVARAYTLGVMPIMVTPRVASRPTKKGYYPMHFEIMKRQPALENKSRPVNADADLTGQPF